MHLSGQGIIVILVVGIVAGWLAGLIVSGGGFGLIGDFIVGIIGAFIGDYLLNHFHIVLFHGNSIIGLIINAVIGAVILLFVLRLVGFGTGGYGRRY